MQIKNFYKVFKSHLLTTLVTPPLLYNKYIIKKNLDFIQIRDRMI